MRSRVSAAGHTRTTVGERKVIGGSHVLSPRSREQRWQRLFCGRPSDAYIVRELLCLFFRVPPMCG